MSVDRSAGANARDLELWVNGEHRTVASSTTLAVLVAESVVGTRGIAVAVDGQVVPRSAWKRLRLMPGARVEIVTAAAGG